MLANDPFAYGGIFVFINVESMINFRSFCFGISALGVLDGLWLVPVAPSRPPPPRAHASCQSYVFFLTFRLSCLYPQCWVMWCLKCSFYEIVFYVFFVRFVHFAFFYRPSTTEPTILYIPSCLFFFRTDYNHWPVFLSFRPSGFILKPGPRQGKQRQNTHIWFVVRSSRSFGGVSEQTSELAWARETIKS